MKTSTEIASAAKWIGEERAVELIARAGFDGWDLSMFAMCRYDWKTSSVIQTGHPLSGPNALSFVRKLKQIGLDNGIRCNQSHAPFPSACPPIRDHLKLAIECTAEAGGEICIIHPDNNATPEENAAMYFERLPFAKSCGVKIATENMWNWDDEKGHSSFAACATPASFNAHLDAVHDPSFVACLDIGHAEMVGSGTGAPDMIRALGSRLQAVHIHDNDQLHDSHQIPFSMKINFLSVIQALKDIDYQGWFTLEADQYLSAYTAETIQAGLAKMSEAAHQFENLFNQL